MIRRSGEEKWRAPKVTSYTDEAALQALVAESPDLLGSSESLAVITEMTVPGVGSVDLVAVGGSGRVTLVECKLRANPEMRRHVIGQVFAYAAGIWSVSYEEFDRLFTARAGRSLTAAVANASGMDVDWDQDIFGRNVAANLGAGRFDLVIAVDSVTDELKQVVRYLNEHTVLEIRVLALELGFVADGDVQVLVPAVYGEESASRKTQGGRKWDEASLFEALERVCPEGTGLIRLLYAKAQAGGLEPVLGGRFDAVGDRLPRCRRYPCAGVELLHPYGLGDVGRELRLDAQQRGARRGHGPPRLRTLGDRGGRERMQAARAAGWHKRPSIPLRLVSGAEAAGRVVVAIDALATAPNAGKHS